jgi:hypothetical protein
MINERETAIVEFYNSFDSPIFPHFYTFWVTSLEYDEKELEYTYYIKYTDAKDADENHNFVGSSMRTYTNKFNKTVKTKCNNILGFCMLKFKQLEEKKTFFTSLFCKFS